MLMNHLQHQQLVHAQRQEAFNLDETRKDNKIEKKNWKKDRRFQIIVLILVILIICSLFL